MYYAYLLRCADGTLYAGYTDDLAKRVLVHNRGKGAKYTRSRLPVTLVYYQAFPTRSAAMAGECALKKRSRAQKLALIQAFSQGDSPFCRT